GGRARVSVARLRHGAGAGAVVPGGAAQGGRHRRLAARRARRWRGGFARRPRAAAPLRERPRAARAGRARRGDRGAGVAVGADRAAMTAASREAELMSRYCDGDRAAFDALYAAVAPKLLGFLTQLVGERALAED